MPSKKTLFTRCINELHNQVEQFAIDTAANMFRLGHKWQGQQPTPEAVAAQTQVLIEQLKFDNAKSIFQTSTGGIMVEIIFWPSNTVSARLTYIANSKPATIDTWTD